MISDALQSRFTLFATFGLKGGHSPCWWGVNLYFRVTNPTINTFANSASMDVAGLEPA